MMDLELTDEQRWLAESVEQLLSQASGRDVWPALLEFGVLSIASGSDGLGAVELVLVGRALGRSLAAVPFVETAAARYAARPVAGSEFAVHAADEIVSLCLLEPGAGWELDRPATIVTGRSADSSVISGRKVAVHHAPVADKLLVFYRDADERRLALVDRDAAGVTVKPTASIDESLQPAAVALDGVEVRGDCAVPAEDTEIVLGRLRSIGGILAASEAVGAAGRLLEMARDYAGQRRQFGRPIGSFQALRHILADMYVKQASAWSTVLFAAAALEDGLEDASLTASIAKAYSSRVTVEVAHGALQVFGGIAFTAEHPAHRFLRRILARGGQFGDARYHERAIGRMLAQPTRREELVA
jgi:alkylation response protein AidB-like acyl-CoA dehydrogenase